LSIYKISTLYNKSRRINIIGHKAADENKDSKKKVCSKDSRFQTQEKKRANVDRWEGDSEAT